MKTRIQKWGNSLALRIPKAFIAEVGLEADSEVDVSLIDGHLVIRPATPIYTLESLLAEINDHNLHQEIDTGDATGKEVW